MAQLLGTGRPWTLTSTGLGLASSMNPNRNRKRNRGLSSSLGNSILMMRDGLKEEVGEKQVS